MFNAENMIRCLIIDDEPLAQEVLENYISQSGQLELAGKCNNALEAFNILHTQVIDLMFLDIKMPGITGLDFIKSLKNPPAVIFTTAYSEYAVTGFELDAIDYLLKPVTYERFLKSIGKLLKIQQTEPPAEKNYTYFKVSGQLVKVLHSDLLYAQSVKDYIHLKTTQGNYLTHMTMKFLNELLPAGIFVRVHRSYLVNKLLVSLVDRSYLKIGDELIPVGEYYKSALGFID
jgi:DNA-binding LytR/AlgR family response regulator